MSFGDAISWLWSDAPVQRRLDLILDAACAGGLEVVAIRLAPRAFEAFRLETDTHLFCALGAQGGAYRGYEVSRIAAGDSCVEVRDPRGRGASLQIGTGGQ